MIHSVHPPPLSAVWVEPLIKFFKMGGEGLTGSQYLEVGCWERGGDFFKRGVWGWLQCLHKN